MTTSYTEATLALAKRRNITEDEASLLVAEEYAHLVLVEEGDDGQAAPLLDVEDIGEAWLREHGRQRPGQPVDIDESRSPASAVTAQLKRIAAKQDGDHYRALSRATSIHEVEA